MTLKWQVCIPWFWRGEANSKVYSGASKRLGIFANCVRKFPQVMLLRSHGAGATGSSQSGAGKFFPTQYKECRLVKWLGIEPCPFDCFDCIAKGLHRCAITPSIFSWSLGDLAINFGYKVAWNVKFFNAWPPSSCLNLPGPWEFAEEVLVEPHFAQGVVQCCML